MWEERTFTEQVEPTHRSWDVLYWI